MPPPPPTPTPSAADDGTDRVRGRLMHGSLKALLDHASDARRVLPYLAVLEEALLQRGAAAVDVLPPNLVERMHAQLGSLPMPPDDLALRDLLARLRTRLDACRRQAGARPRPPQRDDDDLDLDMDMTRTVVIQEISHSEFMAVAGLDADPKSP